MIKLLNFDYDFDDKKLTSKLVILFSQAIVLLTCSTVVRSTDGSCFAGKYC